MSPLELYVVAIVLAIIISVPSRLRIALSPRSTILSESRAVRLRSKVMIFMFHYCISAFISLPLSNVIYKALFNREEKSELIVAYFICSIVVAMIMYVGDRKITNWSFNNDHR